MDNPVQKWLLTVYCQTSFTCWHATELQQVWWLLVFPYFLSHDWSGTRVQVPRKAAELWTHWPQSLYPPLVVICVRLMMMSRMNSMLFSAHTPIQCLFAEIMSPYSQRQEHRMHVSTFLHQNNNYFHMNWLLFTRGLAVARFDWRPFLVNLVNFVNTRNWRIEKVRGKSDKFITHHTLLGPRSLDFESLRFRADISVDVLALDLFLSEVTGISDISLRTQSHSPISDMMASPAALVTHLQGTKTKGMVRKVSPVKLTRNIISSQS